MDRKYRNFAAPLTEFLFCEDPLQKSDVIFLPGNRYPHMAEEAAGLWKQGYAPYIIPSGKWSVADTRFSGPLERADLYDGSYVTEAEFLTDVLLKNGVSPEAVLADHEAAFTYENAIRSRKIAEEARITVKRAILCAEATHVRRSRMYYQLVFPDAEILAHPVSASGITRENWMDTEEGVTRVLGEIERCGGQFREILLALTDRKLNEDPGQTE